MRKLYETLLGVVETGLHPREVGVAVFLGMLAGFVTGWNLSLALVLVLALVMAAPLRVFSQTWAFSAALAWALTPASYRLGVQLLEHSALGNWLRPHAYSVWVALFDLDRFTLVGGAVLGALIGVLAGGIAAFITRSLQTRYLKLVDRFAAHDDLLGRLAIRVSSWLIFGSLSRPQPVRARARMLRPVGAVAGVLLLLPGGFVLWQYTPQWTSSGMLEALSAANQAEVEAADIQLSLADGLLIIDELHIPNAADLHRDRLVLGRVLAEVKPGPLLRGEVLIERLLIEGIETNVARAEPARPCKLEFPAFDLTPSKDSGEAASESNSDSFDFVLDDYVENWEQTRERVERFRELLQEIDRLAGYGRGGDDQAGPADAQPAEMPESYRQMSAARCDFGQPRPRFLVESLRVKNPSTKWGLGEGAECDITNLSSDAPLTGKPTEVKFAAPELGVAVLATLNYHQPGTEHRVRVEARELAVSDLIRDEKLGKRWSLAGGQMDISAVGTLHNGQLNLPVMIGTNDLMLLVVGDEKVAGLPPELWNQGLQKLERFEFAAVLRGPLHRPTLHVDTDSLTTYFRDQLYAAGHAVLVAAIDRELDRGQVRLEEKLAKGLSEAHQATGAVANQAHSLADQADAKVQHSYANTQSALHRGEQSIETAQDRARQYAGQTTGDATGQVTQGQQKAADWLKEQQAKLNPLTGVVPGMAASAGVQSVPDGQAQPQAAPAFDAAQGLIGHAAQVVQQQLESRQQQAEQTITSASERPYYAIDTARTATGQATSQASEGVATVRSGVTETHQQAMGTMDAAAGTIQQSANQASDQVRSAVASTGPAAAPVPLIPPVVEGDVVPVDYPPESETDEAPAPPQMAANPAPAPPPIQAADDVAESNNSSATAEPTEDVAATGPAVNNRREAEPAPEAPVSNKAAAQAKAQSRYSSEMISRGWVDPYATANDEAPVNRVTDPYGTASVASPADTAEDNGTGATSSEDAPVAGTTAQEYRSDSAEEQSVRSAARSMARSRYASSRPYGAPAYQSDRVTDEQPASNATASSETAPGRYRSQYDPLHQEDAAARPRALTSEPAARYGTAHDEAAEPGPSASVAERSSDTPARVYGLKPGQRYSTEYPAGTAARSKPSERARQEMGTAATGERRWSNVPLDGLPGESAFGSSPHELVSRDPSPRELPEVDLPRPPETASAPQGRTPGGRTTRGSLFGSTSSSSPPASSGEESGLINRLKRIWPFSRESSETAATTAEGIQPEVEMAQRPALPPITAEVPAESAAVVPASVEAAPAPQEAKPWYRRLW